MKKRYWFLIGLGVVLIVVLVYAMGDSEAENTDILVQAKKGEFVVDVTTSGELEARNSVEIMGPNGLRSARIFQVEIKDMVDEGTTVAKGDYIAQLDQSEVLNRVKEREIEVQQSMSQYTQTRLDTALELRQSRDELINLKFAVEESEIILSQSQFEPPATIKQAEINVQKAQRAYDQAVENYKLKKEKAAAQMQEAYADLAEDRREMEQLEAILQQFTIRAPEPGMVIYKRTWNGTKKGVGSTIEAWDPVVATLPDLSQMVSRTYVNEVDIRAISTGQMVEIGLDAYPDKRLTGKVMDVANIGEQRPNSDAKVFQVNILINESDTTLRPAMTTSNRIIAARLNDVVFVPLECLRNQGDSITYVVQKEGLGLRKQEVRVGQTNANEAVILEGLTAGEEIFLSTPAGLDDASLTLLGKPETDNVADSSN
jgi:multidrug efflux pump subunit AcrA (membrane-fusion protein)